MIGNYLINYFILFYNLFVVYFMREYIFLFRVTRIVDRKIIVNFGKSISFQFEVKLKLRLLSGIILTALIINIINNN